MSWRVAICRFYIHVDSYCFDSRWLGRGRLQVVSMFGDCVSVVGWSTADSMGMVSWLLRALPHSGISSCGGRYLWSCDTSSLFLYLCYKLTSTLMVPYSPPYCIWKTLRTMRIQEFRITEKFSNVKVVCHQLMMRWRYTDVVSGENIGESLIFLLNT